MKSDNLEAVPAAAVPEWVHMADVPPPTDEEPWAPPDERPGAPIAWGCLAALVWIGLAVVIFWAVRRG